MSFLKTLALGFPMIFSPSPRSNRNQRDTKVLVIGAGMAGASAAFQLAKSGFSVEVLEARDRVGGRVHTFTDWGSKIELGAGWIHQGNAGASMLVDLADYLGMDYRKTTYENLKIFTAEHQIIPPKEVGRFYEEVMERELALMSKRMNNTLGDMPLDKLFTYQSSMPHKNIIYQAMKEAFQNSINAPMEEVSSKYYLNHQVLGGEGDDLVMLGGYKTLTAHFLKDIQVSLNCEVFQIEDIGNRVKVTSSKGIHEADYVICTLPLAVLKAKGNELLPGMPDWKKEAMKGVGTGSFNKIVMRFTENFWGTDNDVLFFENELRNSFGLTVNWAKYTKDPILIAMPVAEAALWAEQNKKRAQEKWLQILRRSFPGKPIEMTDMLVTNWNGDAFSKGAYSYVPVGSGKKAFEQIAAPLGRIRFAGEATSVTGNGTVHGAIESGKREAKLLTERWHHDDPNFK